MKDKSWVESEREELSGDDLDGGQLVRSLRQERREEMRTLMGKSEAVRMAECLGEELGSELNRGMWLGSEGGTKGTDEEEIGERGVENGRGRLRKVGMVGMSRWKIGFVV